MKRRTELTFQIDQWVIVTRRQGVTTDWCAQCGAKQTMVTPDEAAYLISTGTRFLYRLIEDGVIHFVETPPGIIRICLASLIELERGKA